MGLTTDQINLRDEMDRKAVSDAFFEIGGTVMSRRLNESMKQNREQTEEAIGDILKYYHFKPQKVPEEIGDFNEMLDYQLRPLGIMRRSVKLEKGWHSDATGAMLGTRSDDGSIVALLPMGTRHYCFMDHRRNKLIPVNT